MHLATITERIPFLRSRPRPARREILACLPVRNALLDWSEDEREGTVILRVPKRADGLGRLLNRIVAAPSHRQVCLDEVGSDVWRLCDGQHSVEAIITALADRYRLNRREVEVSLTLYLRQLMQRRFLGLLPGEAIEPATGALAPAPRCTKKRKRCKQNRARRNA